MLCKLELRLAKQVGFTSTLGDQTFALNNESEHSSLEQKIVAELWHWSSLANEDRAHVTAPRSFLTGALEFYLCGVFPMCKASEARSWWCDGVLELTITELSPTAFLFVGAAYWAKSGNQKSGNQSTFYLAPFELEFHFQSRGEINAQRIVLRFGSLDEHGAIKRVKHNYSPAIMIHKRPRQDSDWALAVEIA